MMPTFWIIFFATISLFSYLPCVTSQPPINSHANLSTVWINNENISGDLQISSVRIILRRLTTSGLEYACGFLCSNYTCDSTMFAVFILYIDNEDSSYTRTSEALWSANKNNPVGINSTLELTGEGDLVLKDENVTLAWSTNTSGRSIVGLNLTEMGNLVLFDANGSVVWQSFDHPTDCLLPGQTLKAGTNLTESGGLYSVLMTEKGLVASILSHPPQVYYQNFAFTEKQNKKASYAKFQNGSLDLYITKFEPMSPDISITIPKATSSQYMKLGSDGHLRVFEWERNEVADIFRENLGDGCGYPMACGKYGICSNGQCSFPGGSSFRPINDRELVRGCSEVVPLMCNATENHFFLDMHDITYFAFTPDIVSTDVKSCKGACLKDCSCKAAIFNGGECYLPSQIFSFMEYSSDDPTMIVSLKVQIAESTRSFTDETTGTVLMPVLGSTVGVIFVAIAIGTAVFVYRRRKRRYEEVEEDYLDHVPGMPTRFSFEELENATDSFKKKLGEGGFGSVFEGSFNDGTRIAVKRLDGVGHIKKSFLAEVQSIGSIHHINLVRLIGFCAEKSHRLLVYAYMCNGSLERWIYCKSHEKMIEWSCRRNIILDIAKGLAYLHEDCLLKIIHLDIKPQNILLDERFNAKLGDFGLSKLIDRDQSNIVTTMRGTPGYLAPEWLNSAITEKVDVYSFGIVILEIVCGRKIFEQSRPEEERYLPTLFMKKAEEGLWLDLADKCCVDVDSNVTEVGEMMEIAAWCLQSAPQKRPSISMVIKILEGVYNVPKDMDYSQMLEVPSKDATLLFPSVLSGPR